MDGRRKRHMAEHLLEASFSIKKAPEELRSKTVSEEFDERGNESHSGNSGQMTRGKPGT